MVFLLVFHVGNKKKKAKLACFSSFLPAGDRGWWRPGPFLSFFLKLPFHRNEWLLSSFFIDFSGDDLHLFQAYRGVSPLFGSLDSEFPVSVTPLPGLSRQVVGHQGMFGEWMNEPTGRASQACFSRGGMSRSGPERRQALCSLGFGFATKSKTFDEGGKSINSVSHLIASNFWKKPNGSVRGTYPVCLLDFLPGSLWGYLPHSPTPAI